MSLEKAGWYLESYEEKELESVGEDMNFNMRSFGLGPSAVSASGLVIEPSNSNSRQAAW